MQRLLGMTADQFFQVVLLPQGEFARFLRADTAEREQLLERLFGTERFARRRGVVRDRAQAACRELDIARESLREWTARFAQAAGCRSAGRRSRGSSRAWQLARRTPTPTWQRALAAETDGPQGGDAAESACRRAARACEQVRRVAGRARRSGSWTGCARPHASGGRAEIAAARRAIPVAAAVADRGRG